MKSFLQILVAVTLVLATSARPSKTNSDEELEKLLKDLAEDDLLDDTEEENSYKSKYNIPGLTEDGYFNGEKVKSITDISNIEEVLNKIPVKSVEEVSKITPVKSVSSVKSITPVKSIQEVTNIEEVKSIKPIKSIEEVKSITGIKSLTPITSIEEVINLTPIDDDVAKKMLKKFGLEGKQRYGASDDYSGASYDSEEPYSKAPKTGNIERILDLLGISSLSQIKKVTPVRSIQEIESIRELTSDDVARLDKEIADEEAEIETRYGKLKEIDYEDSYLDDALQKEVQKIKKLDEIKQMYEVKQIKHIKKIEDIERLLKIKKMERVKSMKKINSLKRIRSKEEVKSITPIKSIEEVVSEEEVEEVTPVLKKIGLTDKQAEEVLEMQKNKSDRYAR